MQWYSRALRAFAGSLALAAAMLPASAAVAAVDPEDAALAFDASGYTTISVTVDGAADQRALATRSSATSPTRSPRRRSNPGSAVGARRSPTRAAATRA